MAKAVIIILFIAAIIGVVFGTAQLYVAGLIAEAMILPLNFVGGMIVGYIAGTFWFAL